MKLYTLILFALISNKTIEPSNNRAIEPSNHPAIKSPINGSTDALQCVSLIQPATPRHEPIIQQSNHSTTKALKLHSSNTKLHARHTPCGWSRIKRLSFIGAPRPLLPALNHPSDSIPSINQLNHSIDSFYAQQTTWQLLEFKNTKKGEWLKFLPNIGITYTVSGQPRPSISLSSGIFYQTRKARQQKAAKRESIIESARQEAERDKRTLAKLLLRYQLLDEDIQAQRERHQVEREIFLIQEDEYQRLECSPADYLQAKRTFLLQQQALRNLERQRSTLELEILQLAHFPTLHAPFLQTFQK